MEEADTAEIEGLIVSGMKRQIMLEQSYGLL